MRYPAVAGQFYERDPAALRTQIESCYRHPIGPGKRPAVARDGPRTLKGLVVPHAGYMYSGPVAAHAYAALAADGLPASFVVFGPNHTGLGAGMALGVHDWETPLGVVAYDGDLGARILREPVAEDIVAHRHEHSIEVQLPFLQDLSPALRFVPICVGLQDLRHAVQVGEIVREAIEGRDVVVLASTDFSHYIPKDEAARRDRLAIDRILASDDVLSLAGLHHNRDIRRLDDQARLAAVSVGLWLNRRRVRRLRNRLLVRRWLNRRLDWRLLNRLRHSTHHWRATVVAKRGTCW